MRTADAPPRPAGMAPVFGALLAFSTASAPNSAAAQERQVVANRVTVSESEAILSLEFDSGPALEVSFRNGEIRVDGAEAGRYEVGGALDASWRSLLSEAVPLNDGPLAAALTAWAPDARLSGEARSVAERVDRALEEALARPEPSGIGAALRADADARAGDVAGALIPPLFRLLRQRNPALEEVLGDVDPTELSLHVDEDATVDEDSEIRGALFVMNGDATVAGEVPGDVVVVEGTLRIENDARIGGDVRVIDGQLERDGGTVAGAIRTVAVGAEAGRTADAATDEDAERRPPSRQAEARARPFRYVTSGLNGLFRDVFWLAVLLAVGVAVVHFAGERLQNAADAVRAAPGRAALVGMAGGFLLLPVWVLGILVLLVSIIGIPLLIAWLPLFPLAALLAHGMGYLAVASVVGEWLVRKGIPALDRFRPSNQVHALTVGLAALALPSAFSHVAEMGGPALGSFLNGLFTLVAVAFAIIALTLGFGAVLLTGAGRTSDPGEVAAAYGGGIRATRAWTRRRSARSREKSDSPGDGAASG